MSGYQNVTIHGPNIPSDIKRNGEFIVHETGCRDSERLAIRLTPKSPSWVMDAYCIGDIVEEIYSDQISEGLDFDSALADIHFCPCVKLQNTTANAN